MQRHPIKPDPPDSPFIISRAIDGCGLRFPVIAFFEDCMCVMHSRNSLTLGMTQAVSSGYYDQSLIVDRGGTGYRVSQAVRNTRSMLNMILPVAGFIIIDLLVSDVISSYDFSLIKNLVLADVIRRREVYEPDDDEFSVVDRCNTFAELFQYVTMGVEPTKTSPDSADGN
jgi:hypothetical protein